MIFRKIFISPIMLVLVLGAVVLMSIWIIGALRGFSALRREEAALRQKLEAIEAENQRLRDEIRVAATPEAIERDAKARLNLKKPDEEVVVVIPVAPSATTSNNVRLSRFARLGLWLKSLFR